MAVYPAVPIAIAVRADMPVGRRISQSPFSLACCARHPMWDSPTPQPFKMTASPACQAGCDEAMTSPAPSIPGTIGQVRTTGAAPVMARPSL